MTITSLSNPRIKEIIKLKEKKYRDLTNTFLVETEHLVSEAYKARLLKTIILIDGIKNPYPEIDAIYVTMDVMKKISFLESVSNMIGIVNKKEEQEIGNKVLILDDIQNPGNLGTIIRSSVAFDIDTIILSKNSVDLYNPKVLRSTEGMIFHKNIIVKDINKYIRELKEKEYHIYGTRVNGGNDIKKVILPIKFAIVVGNEGKGVSEGVLSLCDEYLYIKMDNKCESLNVSVATSILLYEVYNK